MNSFKPLNEATQLKLTLPEKWAFLENYAYVIEKGNYATGLTNSLVIVVPTMAAVVLLGALTAWAFARSKSMTMKVAYNVTVLSILLPPALLPTIFLLENIGLGGTTAGYILVTIATRLGIMVFLATGFLRAFPQDLEEAAQIDGASRLGTFWHVVLPLLSPVLFVGSILLVIGVWNEFFFASFLLPTEGQATLPLALFRFSVASAEFASMRWNLIFAHVVLTSIPLILVYLIVQKKVLSGLTEGAIKG
ncbi:carbohydrate ABC transporter permease [Microbacterium sp. W4I4]|uniref:carbohydrate ABC transporter permease n=1 Tax=Microbacterium sp. W4I4 TaxID=3042295 RepID=UPI0027D814A2|nr:carbohydrate ABC transporter permease [Microbacterium sp. W4I4]